MTGEHHHSGCFASSFRQLKQIEHSGNKQIPRKGVGNGPLPVSNKLEMRLIDSMAAAGPLKTCASVRSAHSPGPRIAVGSVWPVATMQSWARDSGRTGSGFDEMVDCAWRACAWALWWAAMEDSGGGPRRRPYSRVACTTLRTTTIAAAVPTSVRLRTCTWPLRPSRLGRRGAMSFPPTVLYPLTLHELLNHVLTTHSSTALTILVICSSRDTFVQHLSASLRLDHDDHVPAGLQQLVTPTLHNLFTTRHVKLAFCASVQALLAYLTAYGGSGAKHVGDSGKTERLVLVNPLALHAPTPSFSAQGLSRTFAAAAETALKTGTVLHIAECQGGQRPIEERGDQDTEIVNGNGEGHVEDQEEDPWEQEVSILNVSARRFGSGTGERAWAGRTVKAKRIAGRWFRFHNLGGHQIPGGPG